MLQGGNLSVYNGIDFEEREIISELAIMFVSFLKDELHYELASFEEEDDDEFDDIVSVSIRTRRPKFKIVS